MTMGVAQRLATNSIRLMMASAILVVVGSYLGVSGSGGASDTDVADGSDFDGRVAYYHGCTVPTDVVDGFWLPIGPYPLSNTIVGPFPVGLYPFGIFPRDEHYGADKPIKRVVSAMLDD